MGSGADVFCIFVGKQYWSLEKGKGEGMAQDGNTTLTVEEAITTAIAFETRVRDTYLKAVEAATDDTGRRVFKLLAKEEQGHLDYLNSRLEEWHKTGHVTPEKLATAVPPKELIDERAEALRERLAGKDRGEEVKMLMNAEQVELETSNFYQQMADTLTDEAQLMFQRFLEIEQGHLAIVRAEIDALNGTGYFFDFGEFNLENG